MSIIPANDGGEPDAHGQAALLLAESMLHTLVDKSTLTTGDAIAVVRTAAEVKVEVAQAEGESNQRMQESLALLSAIGSSLETDWSEDGKAKGDSLRSV